MKEIKLQNSTEVVAVVDDEDYERINQYRWLLVPKGYIIRYEKPDGKWCQVRIHNDVLGLPPSSGVDHINGCKWDNCRHNLRVVSQSLNVQNTLPTSRNKTGFKGVYFEKTNNKYRAVICKDGVRRKIGYFETAEKAARAYDIYAIELFGEDALTNKKIRGDY